MLKTMIATAACLAAIAVPVLAQPLAQPQNAKVLIDAAKNISLASWTVSSAQWGDKTGPKWSVTLRTLHGGRQEGVQVIDVDNGTAQFTIVPTRGFEVWKATVGKLRLGWDSPISEIVHPALVNLADNGGQGWLSGFGGWMVRGGLASFGSPGTDGGTQLTLHGHIDYTPASYVSVRYEAGPVPRLVFRGMVYDTSVFGPQLRLVSEISTAIGKTEIAFDDTITNMSDAPQEMEALYHINFGAPLLGAGAEFLAPVKQVAPMNARSAEEGLVGWNKYDGPHPPGYAAQVFLLQLNSDEKGQTAAMLKSADGSQGALLTFDIRGLPYMSLWKNELTAASGYVTGLEPGTGYPYLRSIERAAGRVPMLKGGESHHIHLVATGLVNSAEVAAAADAIGKLATSGPVIQKTPLVP